MTDQFSHNTDPKRREVYELADALLNRTITVEETERLGKLMSDDVEARWHYVRFMHDSAALRQWGRDLLGAEPVGPVSDVVKVPRQLDLESQITNPPFPVLSPLLSPLSPNFVGGPVFSYLTSAVILGVAALVAWVCTVTHHQHIAEAPSQSVPSDARPEMVFVGRITGMVDVKWSDDPRYLPPLGYAYVPLGRKYKLDAGLMQITYDSGAKVILEGPCTYEVESTAGGYLALGKLTARIGERGEGRGESAKPQAANQKSEIRNQKSPSSFILHPSSLFSVRTPTAVITDLGTEFGVEVSDEGDTISHVFRGSVKVLVLDGTGNLPSPSGRGAGGEGSGQVVILGENESARVEKGEGGDVWLVLDGTAVDPTKFTKRLVRPTKPISFSGSYDGSYDPYNDTPPAGQSTWRHGTATLTPTPNDDNGVPAPGAANFNDLSTDARVSVYRPMGAGTFSADQANDEYTFSARLKLHGEDMTTTDHSLAMLSIGFRDEWNGGDNYGKVVMLGWFHNNARHDDNPGGLWFVERHTEGSAWKDAVKINNVNYFDDAWHTYRVDKVLEGGVAKVKVYVDGLLKVKINYDDLPAAAGGDNGFGCFGSTLGTARVTVDHFKYRVYASRPSTSVKGRGRGGPEGNARPSQSPREKTGKEVVD